MMMARRKNWLNYLNALTLSGVFLVGCQGPSQELEPVPGSLNYGGRSVHLTRSPPGSVFTHEFRLTDGRLGQETYRLDEARNPRLMRREIISDWPD